MIMDTYTQFADAVAVAGAAATFNVGDVVDLRAAGGDDVALTKDRDVGQGQPMYWVVTVDAAPTGADSVEVKLVSDAQDPFLTDGSATDHLTTGTQVIGAMTVGRTFVFALPIEGNTYERYLGTQVVGVGAVALADFQVNSFLTLDPTGWKAYREGQN